MIEYAEADGILTIDDEKENRICLIKSGGGTRPDETPATGRTGSGANSCRIRF